MAAGLPVVATRTGGIPEIVQDGENGLLAPPRDPAALAQALGRLMDDSALRDQFRAAGHQTVMEQFTNDAMTDGTLAVYHKIVGR
jgi:glycosyltransferase involved in cell wall biosynthesis